MQLVNVCDRTQSQRLAAWGTSLFHWHVLVSRPFPRQIPVKWSIERERVNNCASPRVNLNCLIITFRRVDATVLRACALSHLSSNRHIFRQDFIHFPALTVGWSVDYCIGCVRIERSAMAVRWPKNLNLAFVIFIRNCLGPQLTNLCQPHFNSHSHVMIP